MIIVLIYGLCRRMLFCYQFWERFSWYLSLINSESSSIAPHLSQVFDVVCILDMTILIALQWYLIIIICNFMMNMMWNIFLDWMGCEEVPKKEMGTSAHSLNRFSNHVMRKGF